MRLQHFVSESEMQYQRECSARVRAMCEGYTAYVDTYGCQQNEADSECMRGMLAEMGYTLTDSELADLIVVNTCAIREHAELRALGNIGHLVHTKRKNPRQRVILAGCMAAEQAVREKVKRSYKQVDAMLDTTSFWRLPEIVLALLENGGRLDDSFASVIDLDNRIAEGMPILRTFQHKASVSIMYGCNNFCSYCIVPYVRGRERSRRAEDILYEVRELIADGCKDIMLLGQNVNSYADEDTDFADLLEAAANFEGEYVVRFMTSHPKDCTKKLIDTIAKNPRIERHLHLPVQSGSDKILAAMNRKYTVEKYLELVDYTREKIPDIALTSDIIVGFPGETEVEFCETLELITRVRYDAMFTFIFSPRVGTPAEKIPDTESKEAKSERFSRLLDTANAISNEKHRALVGKNERVLIDGESKSEYRLAGRTQSGRLVNINGDMSLVGQFVNVEITGATTWSLTGGII